MQGLVYASQRRNILHLYILFQNKCFLFIIQSKSFSSSAQNHRQKVCNSIPRFHSLMHPLPAGLAPPKQLREGDVVVVAKYDRLARSLKDLLEIVDVIDASGAGFRSLAEDIDTTTPAGRLIFHVFASIAQFERERISDRTREGLKAARARGRVGGRPPALSAQQKDEVRKMRDVDHRTVADIARLFGVSERTVRRV